MCYEFGSNLHYLRVPFPGAMFFSVNMLTGLLFNVDLTGFYVFSII